MESNWRGNYTVYNYIQIQCRVWYTGERDHSSQTYAEFSTHDIVEAIKLRTASSLIKQNNQEHEYKSVAVITVIGHRTSAKH